MEFNLDLGKVSVTTEGQWSASKQYERLCIVEYNDGSYVSREPNIGREPGTDGVWQLIAKSRKAESPVESIIPDIAIIRSNAAKGATAYQAPATGIPEEDLSEVVTVKLNSVGRNGKDGRDGIDGINGLNGKDGISPNTSFKSIVFKRSNSEPSTPTGGSYTTPVPSGWSDGVPSGEERLWASTRVFSSDGQAPQQSGWTTPRHMTDTADFDVEYSSVENPTNPTGHPNTNTQWSNTASEDTIWLATSRKRNGEWDAWQVSRIKGEKGSDGTSISIKGTFSAHYATKAQAEEATIAPRTYALIDNNEDAQAGNRAVWYVYCDASGAKTYTKAAVGDALASADTGHLFMADADHWQDIGQFKGDTGAAGSNGLNAYIHIKYAKSLTEGDWSDNDGEQPDKYIGVYADNNAADALTWGLYTWTKWKGDDGYGYEYIYKRTETFDAPIVPTSFLPTDDPTADDFVPSGWTDDPTGVDAAHPYEWLAYRKKTDGVWGAFIGSKSDNAKAALWAKYGQDGKDGTDGQDGANGPAITFRGEFDNSGSTTYVGNEKRCDVVLYNDWYYMANTLAGEFVGSDDTAPSDDSDKWISFGASYDNIATGFLFAEEATIENLVATKLETAKSGERIVVRDNDIYLTRPDGQKVILISGDNIEDGTTRQVTVNLLLAQEIDIAVSRGAPTGTPQRPSSSSSTTSTSELTEYYALTEEFTVGSTEHISISSDIIIAASAEAKGKSGLNLSNAAVADVEICLRKKGPILSTIGQSYEYRVLASARLSAISSSDAVVSDSKNITLAAGNYNVETGTYLLDIRVRYSESYLKTNVDGAYANILVSGVRPIPSTLSVGPAERMIMLGPNGFSADFQGGSITVIDKPQDDGHVLEMKLWNGSAGIKLDSGGIAFDFDGSNTWYKASRDLTSGHLKLTAE